MTKLFQTVHRWKIPSITIFVLTIAVGIFSVVSSKPQYSASRVLSLTEELPNMESYIKEVIIPETVDSLKSSSPGYQVSYFSVKKIASFNKYKITFHGPNLNIEDFFANLLSKTKDMIQAIHKKEENRVRFQLSMVEKGHFIYNPKLALHCPTCLEAISIWKERLSNHLKEFSDPSYSTNSQLVLKKQDVKKQLLKCLVAAFVLSLIAAIGLEIVFPKRSN